MANEVSKIKLPNNNTEYIIKDIVARNKLQTIDWGAQINSSIPDSNLILEYSPNTSSKTGGICYLGKIGENPGLDIFLTNSNINHQVYAIFELTSDSSNLGRIIIIDGTSKEVLRRGAEDVSYHGNTLAYYEPDNVILVSAAQDSNDDFVGKCYIYEIESDAWAGYFDISGGNVCVDESDKKFYVAGGRLFNKGRLMQYDGPGGSLTNDLNLATVNASNPYVVDAINNAFYQGCTVHNNVFYQLYWKKYSMIIAYNATTGEYIKHWNLPHFSNLCKVIDEYQDITYNWTTDNFILGSFTRTQHNGSANVYNVTEIGLYKNIFIKLPSRLPSGTDNGGNGFIKYYHTAYIQVGQNTNLTYFKSCIPCCDEIPISSTEIGVGNCFRSMRDADYAFQQYHPSGGKIRYVFKNSRTAQASNKVVVISHPHFYKPCIVECDQGNSYLQITGGVFESSPFIYLKGTSEHPITLYSGGVSGFPIGNSTSSRCIYRVPNGTKLILQYTTVQPTSNSVYTSLFYVYKYGQLIYDNTCTGVTGKNWIEYEDISKSQPVFTPASGVTINAQSWKKIQGVVVGDLTLTVNSSFAANGSKTIGTVSSGSRPPHTVIGNTRTGSVFLRSAVTTSGTVTFATASSIAANTTIYATFNYISS